MPKKIISTTVLLLLSIGIPRPQQTAAQQLFEPARLDLAIEAKAFTAADVNGDGIADILSVTEGGKITLHSGLLAGGYASEQIYQGPWFLYSKFEWFFTTDVNGDSAVDFIFIETDENTVNVFLGDGTGHFSQPVTTPATDFGITEGGFPACAGDINRDGYTDLVYQDLAVHGVFLDPRFYSLILLGKGDGTFTLSDTLIDKRPSYTFECCVIQDFNEDGENEIAIVRSTGGQIDSLYVYAVNGEGKWSLDSIWGMGMEVQNLLTGDFNNDGHTDVISANRRGEPGYWESIVVRLGDGSGGFPVQRNTIVLEILSKIAAADFNADGTLDIAFLSMDSGLEVAFGNGDGTFSGIRRLNPAFWESLKVIDINGDNFQDIYFHTFGGLSQLLNDGTGVFGTAP
ncbi:VCBS repeat-containing protein, partial [bacterium]|nr:VCBS repeat-containing protein [bacterium]